MLDRWHLDWYLNYLLHNFLDYLRDQYDLLDDPRHDHNLLHYLLNLDASGDLDYLLDYFFFGGWDFLDALHIHLLRNDLLLPDQNRHFLPHDEGDIPDDFHRFLLSQNDMLDDLNWDVLLEMDSLHEGHLMDLGLDPNLGDDDRHLDVLLHLTDLYPGLVDDPRDLDLNDFVLFYDPQHLPDDLDLPGRQLHNPFGRDQFFYDLRDSDNNLLHMDNRHYLLYDLLDDFYPGLHMRNDLRYFLISDHLNNLLYYLRNDDYLLPLDHFLHNLLNNNLNRFGDFLLGLHVPDNFLDDLDWGDPLLDDDLLHLYHHWLLNLDYLIPLDLFRLGLGLLTDLDNHALV